MNGTPPWDWKIQCPVGGERVSLQRFRQRRHDQRPVPGRRHWRRLSAQRSEVRFHRRVVPVLLPPDDEPWPPECAQAYVNTGDARYVHKALVAMCRLAVEYAYLATMTQHRHRNTVAQVERFGQGPFRRGAVLVAAADSRPTASTSRQSSLSTPWPTTASSRPSTRIPRSSLSSRTEGLRRAEPRGRAAVHRGEPLRRLDAGQHGRRLRLATSRRLSAVSPRSAEVLNYRRGTDFMDFLYDGSQVAVHSHAHLRCPTATFATGRLSSLPAATTAPTSPDLGPIVDSIEHLRQTAPGGLPRVPLSAAEPVAPLPQHLRLLPWTR